MDINKIKQLLYDDITRLCGELKLIDDPLVLHVVAANYNWDNGFGIPNVIIENKNCDLGTALMLFYLADGYRMLESYSEFLASSNVEWKSFLLNLYNRIEKKDFNSQKLSYNNELSKVQVFKLKKSNPNIPNIFLNKSPGIDIEIPAL